MDGLASLLLTAAIFSGGPPITPPEHDLLSARATRQIRLQLADDGRGVALDPSALALSLAPDRLFLTPTGWLGVEIVDRLALLLDVRVDVLPTSPDPGRPDYAGGVAARLGVELRPELELRI